MVLPDEPTQGVLIDLDIAARVDEKGAPLDNFPLPYSGTIGFRAVDLIKPDAPTQSFYRHDLESFFYTLVWIAQSRTDISPEVRHSTWFGGRTWDELEGCKFGFLAQRDTDNGLPKVDGMTHVLRRLRTIFARGLRARRNWADDNLLNKLRGGGGIGGTFDETTLGGMVTFERFMDVLDSTCR
jgi:hypothetical protein